jgi:pantoate kinase
MIKAFAPGNISCIFSIYDNKDLAKRGSLGVGFTVNEGATVSIKKLSIRKKSIFKKNKIKNKFTIYFNNKKINFPTVESVINKLNKNKENIEIKIKSKLPLGAGFGISGASALATAYALNRLYKLKRSKKELAKIAHIAEVESGTGLGDVVNQYYGGFLIKFKPSSQFVVKKLLIKDKTIYYKIFSKLDTKKIIGNEKMKNKINKAGIDSLKKIKKIINNKKFNENILKNIINISKEFAVNSGLLTNKKIINLMKKIEKNNGNASMIMLGNAIFSDKKFEDCKRLKIVDKGAYLL